MPDQLPAILRKAGEVVLMVWVITLPSFLIVALAPGDAALSMLRVDTVALSQSEIQSYREQMGLTDPLPVRYWHYLTGLLHGDLGTSVMTGQPVAAEIAQTLPATLLLAGSALALTFVLVILLGTVSAAFRGGWPDRAVSMFNYVAASMPTFWLGLLLIQWFAVDLDLLPASGWHQGLGLVLPTVSLAAAIMPPFIKIYRQSYGETVNKEFVRSARSRGVPFGIIRSRHVLRGSLIPVVTMMGVSLGSLLSGSVVVEAIFGLPGMGKLAVEAVTRRDYGVIQGFVLVIGLAVLAINLLVDLSYRLISPEVRLKGGARA